MITDTLSLKNETADLNGRPCRATRTSAISRQVSACLQRITIFCLLVLFLLPAGCRQQEQPAAEQQPTAEQHSSGTAYLAIGLIPEQNLFSQKKRYAPLIGYLSRKLNITIEIKILPRYGNIIDNFNELGLDGAFFGSFTGALAIEILGVEPLARPQYIGGVSSYYGMVFVRKDSGIHTARDMQGKRVVFVDRATTAGYLLPLIYFKTQGIMDYKSWFREYYYSGTHEDAIYDVLTGLADIGAAKNTVFYRLAEKDPRIAHDLEILAISPHVPANALSVRSDLDAELRQDLKLLLLEMNESVEGRAILNGLQMEAFVETTVEDYKPVIDYANSIGIDLKTYNYLNN